MKVINLLRPASRSITQDFVDRWQALQLEADVDQLVRYIQDFPETPGGSPPTDRGIETLVVNGTGVAPAWIQGSSSGVQPAEAQTSSPPHATSLRVTEHVIRGGDLLFDEAGRRRAHSGVKVIAFLRRRPDLTQEEFLTHWNETHADLTDEIAPPKLRGPGYVKNHVLSTPGAEAPAFDAVAEIFFHSFDGARAWGTWMRSEEARPVREDEDNFMLPSQRLILVTAERLLIP